MPSPSTPLANFPGNPGDPTEDRVISVSKITAPTYPQLQKILLYNQALSAQNYTECNRILNENPELKNCRMDTDTYNVIIDEIKATQVFFLEEVEDFIIEVAQHTIGIDDTAPSTTNAYSSRHTQDLVDAITDVVEVTLTTGGWTKDSSTQFWVQEASVTGMTSSDRPVVSIGIPSSVTAETYEDYHNYAGYLSKVETGTGKITAYCYTDKPLMDLLLQIKGK